MKVAICFYGLVGSVSDKNGNGISLDPKIAYDLNFRNLIEPNDADVFIHSWSKEHESSLLNLYKPKRHLIENQMEFPQARSLVSNRDKRQKVKNFVSTIFRPVARRSLKQEQMKEAYRACSRWNSNKKVLGLKRAYETEFGFTYDCVMVLRLDVGFYNKIDLSSYDMSYFYASHWNDYPVSSNDYQYNFENHNQGKGFLDFWFFSNSPDMDKFAKLYDSIKDYHVSPHRSSYQHASTFFKNVRFTKYRWLDFEMIRRKEYNSVI